MINFKVRRYTIFKKRCEEWRDASTPGILPAHGMRPPERVCGPGGPEDHSSFLVTVVVVLASEALALSRKASRIFETPTSPMRPMTKAATAPIIR